MLWYVSFLVCTLATGAPPDSRFASPADCWTADAPEPAELGPSACMVEGMKTAPTWEHEHPGFGVKAIHCTPGNRPRPEKAA